MDLKKLKQQLESFSPELDRIKDRAKVSTLESFRKQVIVKIEKIHDIEKNIARYGRDIAEYLDHLKKFGFEYEEEERKHVAVTAKVSVKKETVIPDAEEDDL